MSIESVTISNHLILCRPLLLLTSIFPNIRVFSSESALHIKWSKYWSCSFSMSPSNEYSELIALELTGLTPCSPRDFVYNSSNAWKWKVKVKSLSCVWLSVTPWTASYQAPPSMRVSRQEYWSGFPRPSPEWDLIKHKSSYRAKETITNKKPTEWEKMFANDMTNKELISNI